MYKNERQQSMLESFKRLYGKNLEQEQFGFLHRHPKAETANDIGCDHVIVDKKDWEEVRNYYQAYKDFYVMCKKWLCLN